MRTAQAACWPWQHDWTVDSIVECSIVRNRYGGYAYTERGTDEHCDRCGKKRELRERVA